MSVNGTRSSKNKRMSHERKVHSTRDRVVGEHPWWRQQYAHNREHMEQETEREREEEPKMSEDEREL